jgi:hypothetical protein
VEPEPVDLDSLIEGSRVAFESARSALRAASHDLGANELSERTRRLTDERTATVGLLEFARERHAKPRPARGADLVITYVGEIIEQRLAA